MIRFVRPALGLALLASALPAQNTVRWNDLMASLDEVSDTPPAVRVWLDQRMYHYGEPVRVGYRVEEDAFVVVGRVDFNGNLTVLHPAGKNRLTSVSGGTDYFIRSARLGTRATFVANERGGSTGYVFAIASRAPLDVSRLSQRDFSAWVTGVNVGQPMSRYIGDPYRVIQRFARLVLYNPNAEWDYDMEFYSIDQPIYATASNMSYCGSGYSYGYGGYGYSRMRSGSLFDDGYGYDNSGMFNSGCNNYRYMSCYNTFWAYGAFLPVFCGYGVGNGGQVVTGPVPPPVRPDTGATVSPWVPDSVTRPNVDRAPNGTNGPHVMAIDKSRPNPVNGWRAEDDLSFSIPSRALRGTRSRDREGATEITRSPGSATGSGPMPMPSRPIPEVGTTGPQIEWVRPPRSLEPTTRGDIDRMPSRGDIRRDRSVNRDDNGTGRGRMSDWNPPPRASTPIFDREPQLRGHSPSEIRSPGRDFNSGSGSFNPPGGGGTFNPPGGGGSRPMTSPGIESRTGPSMSSPPPAPPPSTGAKSADPPEKKPSEKQP